MVYFLFGALSALSDWLTIRWHLYREAGLAGRTAALSGLLELISWAPVWVAIQTNDLWVMVASAIGASVGTYAAASLAHGNNTTTLNKESGLQ